MDWLFGWRIYEGVIRKGDFIINVNTGKKNKVSLRSFSASVWLRYSSSYVCISFTG